MDICAIFCTLRFVTGSLENRFRIVCEEISPTENAACHLIYAIITIVFSFKTTGALMTHTVTADAGYPILNRSKIEQAIVY